MRGLVHRQLLRLGFKRSDKAIGTRLFEDRGKFRPADSQLADGAVEIDIDCLPPVDGLMGKEVDPNLFPTRFDQVVFNEDAAGYHSDALNFKLLTRKIIKALRKRGSDDVIERLRQPILLS